MSNRRPGFPARPFIRIVALYRYPSGPHETCLQSTLRESGPALRDSARGTRCRQLSARDKTRCGLYPGELFIRGGHREAHRAAANCPPGRSAARPIAAPRPRDCRHHPHAARERTERAPRPRRHRSAPLSTEGVAATSAGPETVVQWAAVTGHSSVSMPRRVAVCAQNGGGVAGCDRQPHGKA
jgi:hypothetical protein